MKQNKLHQKCLVIVYILNKLVEKENQFQNYLCVKNYSLDVNIILHVSLSYFFEAGVE